MGDTRIPQGGGGGRRGAEASAGFRARQQRVGGMATPPCAVGGGS